MLDRDEVIKNLEDAYNLPLPKVKGFLEPNTVIDEDKSVKWNREQVELENQRRRKVFDDARRKRTDLIERARNQIFEYIVQESEGKLSLEQAEKLYYHYRETEDNTSNTLHEIEFILETLIE